MNICLYGLGVILIAALINYLHVRKNVKNWGKEHFTRREGMTLEVAVKNLRMLKQYWRIAYVLSLGILIVIAVNIVMILVDPDIPQYFISLVPVPFIVHFIYRTLLLHVERAEELYREEKL